MTVCRFCLRPKWHWYHSAELFEGHDFVPLLEGPR